MLNITAETGSQIEVTFSKGAFSSVMVQGLINGRRAYLHQTSQDAKAGDVCRVTLVVSPEDSGPCFVRVDEVVRPGDGYSSLLEKTLDDISVSWWGHTSYLDVLANLRRRCPGVNGDKEMLETLLDVLEKYSIPDPRRLTSLEYGHYCIVVSRLIGTLYWSDAQARAALYDRAARYCSATQEGRQWGEAFAAVSASLAAATTATV